MNAAIANVNAPPTPDTNNPPGANPDRLSDPPAGWRRPAAITAAATTNWATTTIAMNPTLVLNRVTPNSATTAQASSAHCHHTPTWSQPTTTTPRKPNRLVPIAL